MDAEKPEPKPEAKPELDIVQAIELAIAHELEARKSYTNLAQETDDPELRTLLKEIAMEEASHEASLRSRLRLYQERHVLRETFSRYVSPELCEEILKNPGLLSLGGRRQQVTVLFADIRNFTSMSEAMAPEAPPVHKGSNILMHRKIRKGNIQQALEKAGVVIERIYRTTFVEHAAMEPESSLALREGDNITVWTSTQNPHYDRSEIASVLGIGQSRVRVIQQATGGGFGGKLDISTQCHAALLAWHTRRPVKLTYSREESFFASGKRHPYTIKYISAATSEGMLLGVKVEIVADTGAYASYGPGVVTRAAVHATGPYEVPHVHVDAYGVYTNNPYCGAMRGFGVPQVGFAHETQMDLLAEALGMDPWEIRKKNFLHAGSTTATSQVLQQSVGIEETMNRVKERVMGEGVL